MALELSIACGDRDLNRPLLTGAVEPEGIDATTMRVYPTNRHRRFFVNQEFDICEVSLASYLSSRAKPDQYPFSAIPVFPNKRFRHSFFYKHVDADVDRPADLAGEAVGVSSWQTTANVWLRGILKEHYGLDLERVEWYRRKREDVSISIPDRFDVRLLDGDREGSIADRDRLKEALFEGELAAAMDPAGSLFNAVSESDAAEFVFEDPLREEREYFRETGIHPPMHVVAIRDEVLQEHPWVAVNVFETFRESRDLCLEKNVSPRRKASMTWGHLHYLEQKEVLGPNTWEYGLTDRNRRGLETFVEYAHDQGLIPRTYNLDKLFVDSTL